jgi:hypothetical protein
LGINLSPHYPWYVLILFAIKNLKTKRRRWIGLKTLGHEVGGERERERALFKALKSKTLLFSLA